MAKTNWKMRFILILLLTPFIVSFPQSCSEVTLSSDDWPMYQHDATHSGASAYSLPSRLVSKWNFSGSGGNLAIANGCVYFISTVYNQIDKLYALDALTGQLIWSTPTSTVNNYFGVIPAVANGYVYTHTMAYNATTGQMVLNYTNYGGSSSPTVAEGMVFIGSGNHIFAPGYVFAINAKTGTLVWNLTLGVGPFNGFALVQLPPAVVNGVAYFSSGGGIYAVNAKTGTQLWHHPINDYVASTSGAITVVNGKVFAGIDQLYCLDASNGKEIWTYPTGGYPSVANGIVYIRSYALNASTGTLIWNNSQNIFSAPTIAGNVVYYCQYQSSNRYADVYTKLYEALGFNGSTGDLLWNYTFPGFYEGQRAVQPIIGNGTLYVSILHDGSEGTLGVFAFGMEPQSTSNEGSSNQELQNQVLVVISTASTIVAILAIVTIVRHRKRRKAKT